MILEKIGAGGIGEVHRARAAYQRGLVAAERPLEFRPSDSPALYFGANALSQLKERERSMEWAEGALALEGEGDNSGDLNYQLRSDRQLPRATLGGQDLKMRNIGRTYELELLLFTKESELILYFVETNR